MVCELYMMVGNALPTIIIIKIIKIINRWFLTTCKILIFYNFVISSRCKNYVAVFQFRILQK